MVYTLCWWIAGLNKAFELLLKNLMKSCWMLMRRMYALIIGNLNIQDMLGFQPVPSATFPNVKLQYTQIQQDLGRNETPELKSY